MLTGTKTMHISLTALCVHGSYCFCWCHDYQNSLCLQAGSVGAQLQAHSLQGGAAPLTLQLPISRRVPLEGAELVAYQEQKRKEEMGALQRPAPQPSDAALAEPTPTRLAGPIPRLPDWRNQH